MTRDTRRGRRPTDEKERKDRIIQTRVPKDLEATLKEAAERERVSVSHLIRNMLEDTFHLVDNIVADSAQLVDTMRRDAKRLAASARGTGASGNSGTSPDANPATSDPQALLEQVEAWQDVVVNKPVQCLGCERELKRGERAFRGLTSGPVPVSAWLCPDCIATL